MASVCSAASNYGDDNIDYLLAAQIDLAIAGLDATNVKQERLDAIQEALLAALLTWQKVNELQKVGMRGDDWAAEAKTRAKVFR